MDEEDFEKEQNNKTLDERRSPMTDEERMKMLLRVVCICKGINLGRVLKGLEGCNTVSDVHRKVGTGSGGCRGERCSPRIKILLAKKEKKRS